MTPCVGRSVGCLLGCLVCHNFLKKDGKFSQRSMGARRKLDAEYIQIKTKKNSFSVTSRFVGERTAAWATAARCTASATPRSRLKYIYVYFTYEYFIYVFIMYIFHMYILFLSLQKWNSVTFLRSSRPPVDLLDDGWSV